ncbi:MAG: DUF433 domain-containing protein [Candidatus Kapaibacterium sp.]
MQHLSNRITIDPDMLGGKPAFRNMRISVETILEFLAAGESEAEILRQYPSLEKEDIQAALEFAAELMKRKYTIKALA